MSAVRLLIFILIHQLHCIQYEMHLNATHTGHAGMQYIFKNDQNVNTARNIWHINPPSQDHYDLLLVLEREWMFNPSMQSQVTLTLNGHTPNISKSDGEFLMVFAVDTHYFSVVIRLDTQRNRWKYFPGILPDSNPSLQTLANTQNVLADIIRGGPDSLNRWKRVSNNDTWTDIEPPYKDALQWPFSIKLTNSPIRNTLSYECILHNKILETEYQTAFMTDKPIFIYILNDADDGKPFDLYSIHVQYEDNQTVNITNTQIGTSTSTSMTQQTELPIFNASLPPTMRPSKPPKMEGTIMEFAASASDKNIVGLMIGVIFGCVIVAILIVLGFFFYFKKEENDNDPSSLNRSEYHTPTVILSGNSISQILEKKRRESQQFAENNKKRKASDTGQRTQSIVPIIDSDGNDDDDDVVIDSDEYLEDDKFNEDQVVN